MPKHLFTPRTKANPKKPIPHSFVLEHLASVDPYTRPMLGCTSIYVGEKIVLILREKETSPEDNGVWMATTEEHHQSLKEDFPSLRSIALFGKVSGWQVLPSDSSDFEESVIRACEMILDGDVRIGKVPGARKSRAKEKKSKSARRKK